MLRADISAEHDTGSTYHDLGYFVGTVASATAAPRSATSRSPAPAFTDLRGQVIAALLPDRHRHQRLQPQSLAAGLQFAAEFGGARADLRLLEHRTGRSAISASAITRPIRPREQERSAISMCKPDGAPIAPSTIPARRSAAASPSTPTPIIYNFPNYQSWQTELTVNGKALRQQAEMDHRPVLLQRAQPQ